MTYEKKYRIARAGLDHLERAFVDMSKAHEEYRNACHINVDYLYDKYIAEQRKRAELEIEVQILHDKYQFEFNKTWWQKLKETIKSKYQ